MCEDYRQMEEAQFKDEEPTVSQSPAMIQDGMTTRQQSSVRLLSGGMSQEDQHLNQQQQQLLMQKVLPSSSKYTAPLYSLASNAGGSHVRSTPSTNRLRNNDRSIVCNLCYEVFSSKPNLLIHSQQVHRTNPKPYQCPTCNKCFANSSYLSQHARIHLGIKPYICPLCHRRFTQLCHLQQHIRTHTGEKPYKCQHPGCTKAFSQLSNLQSHLRSHVTGHMHGQRNSQTYRCHSCCHSSIDDAADQETPSEASRFCSMSYLTQRTTETRDLNSDLGYQIGLRPGNATIPKIRHRMSSGVYAHTGNDELPSSARAMPTLSLGNFTDGATIPVRSEKGEEGLTGTFGSEVREHDLSTRGKTTYLKHYDSQVRKCSSETNSCSILSSAIPWCCEASRTSEKYGAVNTPDAKSSAVIATAKKGAFFTSEINARMKMCNTLFIEMNAGMRSYKSESGKVDSMDDECEMMPVETSARMKTLDDFGTRRKTFDLMAIDASRGSKVRDPYHSEKKETFFSEVPRVNIDQPLTSPAVDGPLNNGPLFPSPYNPL